MKNKSVFFILPVILVFQHIWLTAQPQPGDVFREYVWTTLPEGELFLRVGGRLDYQGTPEKFPADHLDQKGYLLFPDQLDLLNVIKAELTFEKLLSHEDTRNLKVSWNNSPFFSIPESSYIPEPQSEYYYHFYPTIEISVDLLKQENNRFKLKVDPEQDWDWPQNLIYGVILRLYYPREAPHLKGKLAIDGSAIRDKTEVVFRPDHPEKVDQVHFLGDYEGINYEGDGNYRQWHYHYYRGKMIHNIGSAAHDFSVDWNTSWIPDQDQPVRLSAWVQDETGLTYFLPPLQNLNLERDHSVELCKPYNQPRRWVTRGGEHQQNFHISGKLEKASEAKVVWTSWSPGYMNGLFINDFVVLIGNDDHYVYMPMEVKLDHLHMFKAGENTLRTGKTPLYQGQMVHGMEVMWPGMMVLIRYEE